MWYNSHRLHSYLDYQSPNDFEKFVEALEKELN
jgi:putative transposase